ncbi:hypothetical protein [Polyangium sp. 15x6]|uniref:hypothetical protein n=1 Tax=Polyangium sp. 15x6 TaxID=3042687 RepID=UPI00249C8EA5|nr:hypothetical protein [Polyangium sp. 15x6]MDI3288793.1 hypothetical protein [Polyangium sp. 15x6]
MIQRAASATCEICQGDDHTWKKCPYGAEEMVTEAKRPEKKEKPKKPTKKEEQEAKEKAGFGAPVVPTFTRPDVGTTLAHLQGMAGLANLFPWTIAQTMANVGGASASKVKVLPGGKGTEAETWEWVVSRSGVSFVVHYHPNVEIPKGALSGESKWHVKGSRNTKHHESITDDLLAEFKIALPS